MARHRHGRVPAQQGKPLGQRPCPLQTLLQLQRHLEGWGMPLRPLSTLFLFLTLSFARGVCTQDPGAPQLSGALDGAGAKWGGPGQPPAPLLSGALLPAQIHPPKSPPRSIFLLISQRQSSKPRWLHPLPPRQLSARRQSQRQGEPARKKSATITPPGASCDATSASSTQHPPAPRPCPCLVAAGAPGCGDGFVIASVGGSRSPAAFKRIKSHRSRRDVAATGFYLAQAA